jgi:tRNA dimethylallyltransferase
VYRGFDIGTAKVAAAERRGVPHHLTDLVAPAEVFHAGEYRRRAIVVLGELAARGKLPILTVGTGLYLRALLEGLCEAPERSAKLRDRLARRVALAGPESLHRLLERLDPVSATRIGLRDVPKMIRAIEVRLVSGKALSALQRAGRQPLAGYWPIKIGLAPPRSLLYERIDRRVHEMLDAGWLDEVRSLVDAGVPSNAKPFQFLGYSLLRDSIEGRIPLDQAASRIRQATRRYAKRQITWFRRETDVFWQAGFGDNPAVAEQALAHIQTALALPGTVTKP